MDESYVDAALEAAEHAFRDPQGQTAETGLEVDDEALVQLRKACRLLEAARELERQNGFYTVIIETSFVAIERSIQAFLLERGYAEPADFRHGHAQAYERGAKSIFSVPNSVIGWLNIGHKTEPMCIIVRHRPASSRRERCSRSPAMFIAISSSSRR